jgi:O-antigen ligase/tetratricopeptide (TPR) repeat protein
VAGFVIYAIIRYSQAEIEFVARQELIRILVYAFLFLLILNNLHRQGTTRLVVFTLLLVGVALSMYAIYQFLTGSESVLIYPKPPQYRGRGSGTYICPNHLAGFLGLVLPLALANLFLGKCSHVLRVVYGYASVVILAGIGVTISRGGYLATGLGMLVFFGILIRYQSYRRPALITLLIILIGAYAFVHKARQPQKRLSLMFTPGQLEDTAVRPSLWGAAVRMWKDHFWLGVGPAHFDYRFRAYRPEEVQSRPYWVHNDYLNAVVDWGAAGGVIIGITLVCLGAGAVRTWKYVHRVRNDLVAKRSDRAAHVLGCSMGLLIVLIHSAVDFNMQIPANAIVAITLMASLTSHLRFATRQYWVTPHLVGRVVATIIILVGLAYLAPEMVTRFRELRYLRQAQEAKTYAKQLAALTAAFEVEPNNADTAYMIGEAYRLQSWEGDYSHYPQLARQAMKWFDEGMRLNPYETYNYLRYGMCLDWLGRHAQADTFFKHALETDPNNYYIVAMQGWHHLQKRDYATAKEWLEKSLQLKWYNNSIANFYLDVVRRRLAEPASP